MGWLPPLGQQEECSPGPCRTATSELLVSATRTATLLLPTNMSSQHGEALWTGQCGARGCFQLERLLRCKRHVPDATPVPGPGVAAWSAAADAAASARVCLDKGHVETCVAVVAVAMGLVMAGSGESQHPFGRAKAVHQGIDSPGSLARGKLPRAHMPLHLCNAHTMSLHLRKATGTPCLVQHPRWPAAPSCPRWPITPPLNPCTPSPEP